MATFAAALDDGCDQETLTDVLAFVESFEGVCESDARPAASCDVASPPQALAVSRDASSVYGKRTSEKERRRQSKASAKNRARVARYWKRKDELQSLRSMVEYLTNVLEVTKRSPQRPWSPQMALDYRTAASQLPASMAITWEQCAKMERELRRRADETNTQLRRLIRRQMQWSQMVDEMLKKAWWGTWEYYLSCPFKTYKAPGQFEHLSWASVCSARAVASGSSSAWSTSFSIPAGDPQHIGGLWWATVQKLSLFPGSGISTFSIDQASGVRVTKKSSWSVQNDANEKISFNGEVAFEVSRSDTHWTLVSNADVSDTSGTKLLFRTFAVRAVTLAQTSAGQACEFQAHYWVDYPNGVASAPRVGNDQQSPARAKEAYVMEIGVTTWTGIMRQKDQHMRVLFGERPSATTM